MQYNKLSKYHEILEKTHGRVFIKSINNGFDWHGVYKLRYKSKPKQNDDFKNPDFMKPYKPKNKINPVKYLEALWAR